MEKLNKIMYIIGLLLVISLYSSELKSQDILENCTSKDLQNFKLDIRPKLLQKTSEYNQILNETEIRDWLSSVVEENIKMYQLSEGKQEYLILSSTIFAATGLTTNFYTWILIDLKNKTLIKDHLMSLSCNPDSFYFRKGVFYIVEYKFGDGFYVTRNYDKPDIERIRYILRKGKLIKNDTFNFKCE